MESMISLCLICTSAFLSTLEFEGVRDTDAREREGIE